MPQRRRTGVITIFRISHREIRVNHTNFREVEMAVPGKDSLSPTQQIWLVIASGALLAGVNSYDNIPSLGNTDSSLSLYAASGLLRGAIPYKDIWYDRMPGSILTDAAALGAWNSFIAVMLLEICWITLAAFLLKKACSFAGANNKTASVTAGWFWMLTMSVSCLGGPNSAQVWALPFIIAFAMLVFRPGSGDSPGGVFIAGVCAGAAACFIAREAVLLFVGLFALRKNTAFFVIGFLSITATLFAALAAFGSLSAFGDATLLSNWSAIIGGGWLPYFTGDFRTFLKLAGLLAPLLILVIPAVSPGQEKPVALAVPAALKIWLGLEILALAVNGPIGPSTIISAAIPVFLIWALSASLYMTPKHHNPLSRSAVILFFIVFLSIASDINSLIGTSAGNETVRTTRQSQFIAQIVDRHCGPSEKIQVWGGSALTYVLSSRAAVSRFPTAKALMIRGYSDKNAGDFINEIDRNPPAILVLEASLLPEGTLEKLPRMPYFDTGPEQDRLFAFLQDMVRLKYRIIATHLGVIICRRSQDG